MNILITGGNGTIGSFLKSNLQYNILTPSRKQLDLMSKEAVDKFFEDQTIDIVIHCALTGRNNLFSTEPSYTTDSLWMFRHLWNNKHKFKKFINLGTAYELDLKKNNFNVTEEEFLKYLPNTSYGYAKNLITRVIYETDNFYNLRLFGVFHEHEDERRLFKKLLLNKSIEITNDIYMDYIYLGDVLPVVNRIIEDEIVYRDINMVYEQKYKLSDMAKMFCDINGINSNYVIVQGTKQNNLTGNPTRLKDLSLDLTGLTKGFSLY